jgi:hypothetical protein
VGEVTYTAVVIDTIVDNRDELGVGIKGWANHWVSEFLMYTKTVG